ncbi:MAG: hypothetical protein C0410_08960 [Anaerolinea sp.]|nr:hypothetical protein [Anaerolinea sp.]
MKKTARLVLAIMFVFGIILASAPLNAQAKQIETVTPNPLVAGGSWSTGSNVDVSTLAASAPTWLQLLTGGVKVTDAGKICHPFRGGQFGWVGIIMQYKDGQWVKLATTNDWVPNKEGEFMSCAQAPAAGTYALFGYWKRPAGYVEVVGTQAPTCNYSTDDWSAGQEDRDENGTFDIIISGLQSDLTGQNLSLLVTNDPDDMLANDSYSANISSGSAQYVEVLIRNTGTVDFTVTVSGCSKAFSFEFNVD